MTGTVLWYTRILMNNHEYRAAFRVTCLGKTRDGVVSKGGSNISKPIDLQIQMELYIKKKRKALPQGLTNLVTTPAALAASGGGNVDRTTMTVFNRVEDDMTWLEPKMRTSMADENIADLFMQDLAQYQIPKGKNLKNESNKYMIGIQLKYKPTIAYMYVHVQARNP